MSPVIRARESALVPAHASGTDPGRWRSPRNKHFFQRVGRSRLPRALVARDDSICAIVPCRGFPEAQRRKAPPVPARAASGAGLDRPEAEENLWLTFSPQSTIYRRIMIG